MREETWLRRIAERFGTNPGQGILGPGDDAALISLPPGQAAVLTCDALVDGIHFEPGWLHDDELGSRLLRICLSDLAAMAATPRGILVAVETPELPGRVGEEFWNGVEETLQELAIPLLGGNLTRTSGPLALTATALGSVEKGAEIRRDGAQPGEAIWITGTPGAAGAARRILQSGKEHDPGRTVAWRRPEPRIAIALDLAARQEIASAIDVSDGLGLDLTRLSGASGVGAAIALDSLLRARADLRLEDILDGGEDYELLFTSPADRPPDPEEFETRHGVPLIRLGTTTEILDLVVTVEGKRVNYTPHGWDPFA